jgi:hypothetical protein
MGLSAFGWPLIAGGALKIAYDLMLLRAFARVRPPEEAERGGPAVPAAAARAAGARIGDIGRR